MKNRKITKQEAEAATAADFKLFLFLYSFDAIQLSFLSQLLIYLDKTLTKNQNYPWQKRENRYFYFLGRSTYMKLKKKLSVTYSYV